MSEITYKTCGKYAGLHLWYNAANGHQYQMKIWKNFRGITYRELVNDKVVYSKAFYYSVSSWDYQTAFTLLRSHFGLIKDVT